MKFTIASLLVGSAAAYTATTDGMNRADEERLVEVAVAQMPEFPVPADEVFQVLVGRRGVGGRVQFLLRVEGEAPLEEVAECAEALLHALDCADEEEEVEVARGAAEGLLGGLGGLEDRVVAADFARLVVGEAVFLVDAPPSTRRKCRSCGAARTRRRWRWRGSGGTFSPRRT